MEGVVRAPSAFSMTLGAEPSITATQELVVPRSMPITLAILCSSYWAWGPDPRQGRPPVHPIEFFDKISHGPKPCLYKGVYREGCGKCQAFVHPKGGLLAKSLLALTVQFPEGVIEDGRKQGPTQIGQKQQSRQPVAAQEQNGEIGRAHV